MEGAIWIIAGAAIYAFSGILWVAITLVVIGALIVAVQVID